MEISRLFTKTETEPPAEQFLAIQIQEGVVQTAVWQVQNGVATIVKFGSSQQWENEESLVLAVDASLAVACQGLVSEPNRVILGLPEYWIEADKIASEQGLKLKNLLAKLELTPLGFVTTTEAVLQQLKLNEGIPPSVVIVELGKTRIGVVVTHLGQVQGREEVGRSADLAADVEEGLARINASQLPSRILIIDGVDPEAQQQLASYSWQEKLPFLHLPKVESLGEEFSVKAVALAGGAEAAAAIGLNLESPSPTEAVETVTEPSPALAPAVAMAEGEDFGFVVDEDIRSLPTKNEEPTASPDLPAPPEAFKSRFKGLTRPKITLPKLPQFKFSAVKILAVLTGLLLLTALGSWAYYSSQASATVVVTVDGQTLNRTIEVAVGDAKSSGVPSVTAEAETISLEKTDSISTTGEAVVGERASGEVTVFNKTDTARTLEAGAVLTTSNNLRFTINEAVTIASRSVEIKEKEGGGGQDQSITFGSVTVGATAVKIGSEYNIGSNTSLSVEDYPKSSLEAKNTKEFTGGSSRTVKAVSRKDRDELMAKVSEAIKQEAVTAQEARANGEYKTATVGELSIISQKFSKGVDEEADELSLTLTAEVKLLRFSTESVKTVIIQQLTSDIPSGFQIDAQKLGLKVESVTENGGVMVAKMSVEAQLTPQVDLQGYKQKMVGKSVTAAAALLENFPHRREGGTMITIKPQLPLFSRYMPASIERIELLIETVR